MKKRQTAMDARGFSLVELMIVMLIFAGVTAAGYAMYSVQQRTYLMQEQLVDLQQSVRTFLYYIEKDLRTAGFDPRREGIQGILVANSTEMIIEADIGRSRTVADACTGVGCDTIPDGLIHCEGTGCNRIYNLDVSDCDDCVVETMRYALPPTPAPKTNGQVDVETVTTVNKTFNGRTNTGSQAVIENVQALEFLYNMNDGTAVTTVSSANLTNIRSVTVSLLVRTRNPLRDFRNPEGTKYCPASNPEKGKDANGISICESSTGKSWGTFNDNYKRRLIITNILCRNMAYRTED